MPSVYSELFRVSNISLAKDESYTYLSDQDFIISYSGVHEFYTVESTEKLNHYRTEIRPTKMAYLLEGKDIKEATFVVTTAQSWLQLNKLLSPGFEVRLKEILPNEFIKIANQAKLRTSKNDQIEFVASEIQKIVAYSGDWRTHDGKFKPKGNRRVIDEGKGDCKDYATAMVSILRYIGFDAYVALTSRGKYAGKETEDQIRHFPVFNFNHAIVAVKNQTNGYQWIDPTNPLVITDILNNDILNAMTLVLDGTSQNTINLPSRNAVLPITRIDQEIKINADNTASSQAKLTLNPPAYNSVGMVERQYGDLGLKAVFNAITHPFRKVEMTYKKDPKPNVYAYDFFFSTQDWVKGDNLTSQSIFILNPLALEFSSFHSGTGFNLEEGEYYSKARVKNAHVENAFKFECLIRNPILDFDRTIDQDNADVIISDHISTHKFYIESFEMNRGDSQDFFTDISTCINLSHLPLNKNALNKTAEEVMRDTELGPPVETMSDSDAEVLHDKIGSIWINLISKKLFKYYSLKITKNANDSNAILKRSKSIKELGYKGNNKYQLAYVTYALNETSRAIALDPLSYTAEVYYERIKMFAELGDLGAAHSEFKNLSEKFPKNFVTFLSGSILNHEQKKYDDALKWVQAGQNLAITKVDKKRFHEQMSIAFEELKQYKAQITEMEFLVKEYPKNAWYWNNLAGAYYSDGNYDRVIELEQKAMAILDFAAPRAYLSDAYYLKSVEASKMTPSQRTPANQSNQENFLLESLKFNSHNLSSLVALSQLCFDQYKSSNERKHLDRGSSYLEIAYEVSPKQPEVLNLMGAYKALK